MEIEKIKKQVKRVIEYSQDIDEVNVDNLIDSWYENKRDLIENYMGGNIIVEFPEIVSFELSDAVKSQKVEDFCGKIENRYDNRELSNFIYYEKDFFFNNRVGREYTAPDGETIPVGMKLSKAFKFFEPNEETLRVIQIAASMLIQEDKISGKLCFSVHPLDFLSSSENIHNWRSCHALDGDYRAGNLSYMTDSCTFMCYLKADDKNVVLPHFPSDVPWNSKKWRTLMFISDFKEIIFAGRQYPFSTNTGIDFVRQQLNKPPLSFGTWGEWRKDKIKIIPNHDSNGDDHSTILYSPYVPVGDRLIPMSELVKNGTNSLQFNDLLSSSCYDPIYCFKQRSINSRWFDISNTNSHKLIDSVGRGNRFVIGGGIKCLRCGQDYIHLSSIMTCDNCELKYGHSDDDYYAYCSYCDSRYISEDGIYVDKTGDYVCPSCAQEYTAMCEFCGDIDFIDNMTYDKKSCMYICKDCVRSKK